MTSNLELGDKEVTLNHLPGGVLVISFATQVLKAN